jgi:cation transport ATPase
MKETRLILKGATCPSCRLAIEKYTRKLQEVEDISMDTAAGILTITHSEPSDPAAEVKELVRKLGYDAEIIYTTPGDANRD